MTVQSIGTPVQERNVTGNHLFMTAGQVSRGEMHGIGELHYLPQKIRPCPKALDDARNLFSTRSRAPEVIGSCRIARRIGIFNNANLGARMLARIVWRQRGLLRLVLHALIVPRSVQNRNFNATWITRGPRSEGICGNAPELTSLFVRVFSVCFGNYVLLTCGSKSGPSAPRASATFNDSPPPKNECASCHHFT